MTTTDEAVERLRDRVAKALDAMPPKSAARALETDTGVQVEIREVVAVLDALEARDKAIGLMANSLQIVGYNDVDYAKAVARADAAELRAERTGSATAAAEAERDGYLADLQHVQAERNTAEAKLARIVDFIGRAGLTSVYGRLTPDEARELDQIINDDKEATR